ncbi:MAG: DUF4954 family protein [Phycisphaeraceae bacterium]|nr:DUF4954 family protein [Phycisphaeraceae bacterium]
MHQPLTPKQIEQLQQQGCRAADWSRVRVSFDFDPARVHNVRFEGDVTLGALAGDVTSASGLSRPCAIADACLINCTVGNNVRIARIGTHIAHYHVSHGACIEDVGLMQTNPGASFGNGVEIEVLNEGGGREVILFNELSSQFAYLLCLHRFRPAFIDKLIAFARAAAQCAIADIGRIGHGAKLANVGKLIDCNVGDAASIWGATSLVNTTILSAPDAPTLIGDGVQGHNCIVAEGTQVTEGAILSKTYVGQGCRVGKQFSAENTLFFANCEAFHGEACSVFAGPYTVTHHKSTLLIAALFSFYNAGSGTNQSNHMYKLGPVHEGKLERGCKTGSFSYMMWPCRVGPFSVVMGKHTRNFDLSQFPFSHIEADHAGRCSFVPGLNLSTVGTVRDGAKWPARDRRKGNVKRDRIDFDVFSPLTVGRMIKASEHLKQLQKSTDRSIDEVTINGATVKRVLLRTGSKFYDPGIQCYLLEKIVTRLEAGQSLAAAPDGLFSEDWLDICGQMMPRQRMLDLCAAVESGKIADLAALEAALDDIHRHYAEDEWAWIRWAYQRVFGAALESADPVALADQLLAAKSKFLNLILIDAGKEFDEQTQTGFGHDGEAADRVADFAAVRGDYDHNKFVQQMKQSIEQLGQRIEALKKKLSQS